MSSIDTKILKITQKIPLVKSTGFVDDPYTHKINFTLTPTDPTYVFILEYIPETEGLVLYSTEMDRYNVPGPTVSIMKAFLSEFPSVEYKFLEPPKAPYHVWSNVTENILRELSD